MKKTILIIALLLFVTSASAEITIQPTTSGPENTVYDIGSGDGAVWFIPSIDVLETYVFVDGDLVGHYDKLSANSTNYIKTDAGVHAFEVRSLVKQHYFWDNYKITEDDYPFTLAYATYDKDDKKLNFAIKGADAIHPDDLNRTGKSIKKKFDDYTALLNDQVELECYPLITTGKAVPFNCYSSQYAYTLDISMTIGFMENTTVNVTRAVVEPEPFVEPEIEDRSEVVEGTSENEVQEESVTIVNDPSENELSPEDNSSLTETDVIVEAQGNDWIVPLVLLIIIILVLVSFVAKKKQGGKTQSKKDVKGSQEKIKNKIKK